MTETKKLNVYEVMNGRGDFALYAAATTADALKQAQAKLVLRGLWGEAVFQFIRPKAKQNAKVTLIANPVARGLVAADPVDRGPVLGTGVLDWALEVVR